MGKFEGGVKMMGYIMVVLIGMNIGNNKITPSLQEIMKNTSPSEKIAILVHLNQKPDFETIKNLEPEEYVEYLQNFSENSQKEIISYIKNNFKDKISDLTTYWIFNGFYVKATKDVIEALAKRDEVEYIIEDFIVKIDDVMPEEPPTVCAPTWNIKLVKADLCWNAGYTGRNIIIGQMDTGVDVNHPALSGKWISPYWYDAANGQTSPYDDNGHGTHAMGTILGGDGNGSFYYDIGVAPGARFVACKIFNSSGSGYASWIHGGFQKIAQWRSQGLLIRVVSNSWGSTATTSTEFWQDCVNWRNLGIFPVFAIGNNGPYSATANTPGNFPIVIGVGATNSSDYIASFSARGPAPNLSPWTNTSYWMRPDWNRRKPDICAPGVSIYSALPGGRYGTMSGTSMACPHVAGAIAIILQRNSSLSVPTIYNLLLNYADRPSHGAPYPNNTYGWGRLNVYAALYYALSSNDPNIPEVCYTEDEEETILSVNDKENTISSSFLKIYPGITRGELYLNYLIPGSLNAEISVFNSSGRMVKTFYTFLESGKKVKRIDLNGLSEGIYLIKINTPSLTTQHKVILVK